MARIPILGFKSKTDLTKAVREEINTHAINEEFESTLITRLISERHYFCAARNIIPVRFKKIPHPEYSGAYFFMGYFVSPAWSGWHGVSWTKCINGWTVDNAITQALRLEIRPILKAYQDAHPKCEHPGCTSFSCDVHHAAPTFLEIATGITAPMTDGDKLALMTGYNWIDEETFTLPPETPCVRAVIEAHATAKLVALCKTHHKAERTP